MVIRSNFSNYKNRHLYGITINLLIFYSASVLINVNTNMPCKYINDEIIAAAIITEPPEEKKNTFKSVITLRELYINETLKSVDEDLIVFFEKSEAANSLKYGDKILFKGRINVVKNSGNPNEFDYQEYLLRKGITGQIYLKANVWKQYSQNEGSKIYLLAYKIRNNLSNIFKSYDIDEQESAVLQALTLGDKSELNSEMKASYSSSGAMHILAVSGLHVGILFFLFNFFLKYLNKLKSKNVYYGSIIKAFILIILLWSYAVLSGLSPSVLRAVIMFSFVIIGQTMKRKINIYNSLSASAFVILIFDPYQITALGFQLSYTAVLAIVFFQPKIAHLFVIKNKILYYIWSLTAVSIAAQIGTFPLSLYYFNSFPNLFFITNIVAIPTATLIIYTTVFLFIFSAIPSVSIFFAYILKHLVKSLNFSVEFIEKIPVSHTENIPFSEFDILFAYLLISAISFYLIYKKPKSLQFSLLIIIIWISINSILKIKTNLQTELIVFNIKNETCINIIEKNNILIGDSSITEEEKILYGPMNYWLKKGKTEYEFKKISGEDFDNDLLIKRDNMLCIQNKVLIFIKDRSEIQYQTDKKLKADYIILSKNPDISISEVKNLYDVKLIISDASNNYYMNEKWKRECTALNQKYFSVSENGAYSERLD